MSALLVDLGGTHLRFGLSSEFQQVHVVRKIRIAGSSPDGDRVRKPWPGIVEAIGAFADEQQERLHLDAPLVMSFPGPVLESNRILGAPTVTGPAGDLPDLASLITKRTRRRVHILNDVSAAAWYFEERLPESRFMVTTVSSGIGSKIFDRRHRDGVLDDVAYAGEIGHLRVDGTPSAPTCDCGGVGHLGAIASGRGIEREARLRALSDPAFKSSQCHLVFGATSETLNNEEHLVPAARSGDQWALGIVREATQPLVRVLLTAAVAAGLERVVIIGGFALAMGKTYRRILQESVSQLYNSSFVPDRINGLIVMGHEDACLHGAARYARQVQREWAATA